MASYPFPQQCDEKSRGFHSCNEIVVFLVHDATEGEFEVRRFVAWGLVIVINPAKIISCNSGVLIMLHFTPVQIAVDDTAQAEFIAPLESAACRIQQPRFPDVSILQQYVAAHRSAIV